MSRDNGQILHERRIYSILDFMGDLGGVLEVVMVTFGIFLNGISEHSFYTRAIKKFYSAKTRDDKIFRKNSTGKKMNDDF